MENKVFKLGKVLATYPTHITIELIPQKEIINGIIVIPFSKKPIINVLKSSPLYELITIENDENIGGVCGHMITIPTKPYYIMDDNIIIYKQSPLFYNNTVDQEKLSLIQYELIGEEKPVVLTANTISVFIFEGDCNEDVIISKLLNWIEIQNLYVAVDE